MTLTLQTARWIFDMELPVSERSVSVRGQLTMPVAMLDGATVRLDVADTTMGVPMWQGISNPMEAR